ncbi:cyclin-like protein [Coprinopsis marcescibilis]|uniref:Cyclin-like protein n=1 Tax=Coprinopsis marcescibilis TaxID=230819 RepID=A0A5C3L5R9_COPMA|nr:cyclin-like protein [Coprinopsis marcescibilis]
MARAQSPPSTSRYHHPYFTPTELDYLSVAQRGRLSMTQEEKARQNACGFIDAMCSRIGFPRRTVATAQSLYHRFHLYFPRKDFVYTDVCLAALYVSSKMHDTLKKPKELLAVMYGIRDPALAAKSKYPSGEVDLDTMDPQVVESDRQRLLAIERLVLETICFNFTSRLPFPFVIKIGRVLKASKKLIKFGWRVAIDCHRTLLPLQYPPHTVAVGSLYIAALLSSFEVPPEEAETPNTRTSHEIAELLGERGEWEQRFQSKAEDLEDIAHTVLDLFIQTSQNTSANTSPSTPSSPHPHSSNTRQPPTIIQSPWKSDQLIRLKIAMREKEHPPRSDLPLEPSGDLKEAIHRPPTDYTGKNEGTVRFLFGPPNLGYS